MNKIFISIVLFLTCIADVYADTANWLEVKIGADKATASSTLKEKNKPASYYGAMNAGDGDMGTAWCSNAHGEKIKGEFVEIEFDTRRAIGVQFLPGYGKNFGSFKKNNRISKAKITVFEEGGAKYEKNVEKIYTNLCHDERQFLDLKSQRLGLELKTPCVLDGYENLGANWHFDSNEGDILHKCINKIRVEILDVVKGDKYDDTCIAEIKLMDPFYGSNEFKEVYNGDQCDRSPLYIASRQGNTDVVRQLLETKIDVNKSEGNGSTPLYAASSNGHSDIVMLLLEAKADVDKIGYYEGWTPLFISLKKGHLDIVKLLLEAGADVNKATKKGLTPLMIAKKNNHSDIVKLLKEYGAKE